MTVLAFEPVVAHCARCIADVALIAARWEDVPRIVEDLFTVSEVVLVPTGPQQSSVARGLGPSSGWRLNSCPCAILNGSLTAASSCRRKKRVMQSLLQRAFELAPECSTMKELRKRLSDEGYDGIDADIGGLGTKRQLRALFNQGQGVWNAWNRQA